MFVKLTETAWSSVQIHDVYADDDGLESPEFLERHRTLQARASAKGIDLRSLSPEQCIGVAHALDEIADAEEAASVEVEAYGRIDTRGLRSAASKIRRLTAIAQVRDRFTVGATFYAGGRPVVIAPYSDDEAAQGKVRVHIGAPMGNGTLVNVGHLSR